MWLKILLPDLRAQRVLTPEGLKWEETADPSSCVTPTGPPGLRNVPGRKGRRGKQEILLSPHNTSELISPLLNPVWAFV